MSNHFSAGVRVAQLYVVQCSRYEGLRIGGRVNKYYWMIGAAVLVVGFQNCSNGTQFVSAESQLLKASGELMPVETLPEDEENENIDTVENDNSPSIAPPAPPAPVADMPPAPPAPPSPVADMPPALPAKDPVVSTPVENDEDDDQDEEVSTDDGDRSYICILQGPGKSVKVGIVSDLLGGSNSASASVCMSKHACLDLMSQKFSVKGAEKRGYCPAKNKNAVDMSDAEIKAKLLQQ